jgi:hypothetical protein
MPFISASVTMQPELPLAPGRSVKGPKKKPESKVIIRLNLDTDRDLFMVPRREPYILYYRKSLNASRFIEDAHVFDGQDAALETLAKLNDLWRDSAEVCVLAPSPSGQAPTTG